MFPLAFCPLGVPVAIPFAFTHIANTTVHCYLCLSFKEVNRWEVTCVSSLCPLLLSFVQVSIQSNRLSLEELPLLFSCRAGLLVTGSLGFCFSFVKKLFPFHCLKGIVAGHKILSWQFFSFSFSALERFHCLLVSDENALNSYHCFSVYDPSFFLCLLLKLSCYHLFSAIWLWCILVWGFYVNPDWSFFDILESLCL